MRSSDHDLPHPQLAVGQIDLFSRRYRWFWTVTIVASVVSLAYVKPLYLLTYVMYGSVAVSLKCRAAEKAKRECLPLSRTDQWPIWWVASAAIGLGAYLGAWIESDRLEVSSITREAPVIVSCTVMASLMMLMLHEVECRLLSSETISRMTIGISLKVSLYGFLVTVVTLILGVATPWQWVSVPLIGGVAWGAAAGCTALFFAEAVPLLRRHRVKLGRRGLSVTV